MADTALTLNWRKEVPYPSGTWTWVIERMERGLRLVAAGPLYYYSAKAILGFNACLLVTALLAYRGHPVWSMPVLGILLAADCVLLCSHIEYCQLRKLGDPMLELDENTVSLYGGRRKLIRSAIVGVQVVGLYRQQCERQIAYEGSSNRLFEVQLLVSESDHVNDCYTIMNGTYEGACEDIAKVIAVALDVPMTTCKPT